MARLGNAIVTVAAITAATVAAWHGVITGDNFVLLVSAAMGIGGVIHSQTGGSSGGN